MRIANQEDKIKVHLFQYMNVLLKELLMYNIILQNQLILDKKIIQTGAKNTEDTGSVDGLKVGQLSVPKNDTSVIRQVYFFLVTIVLNYQYSYNSCNFRHATVRQILRIQKL